MSQLLKIESMVYGGSGLARMDDGKVVLLPCVLPDEIVEVGEISLHGNHFRGRASKILEKHISRVAAPCPYYGVCGGCHYQHAAYSYQLELKMKILQEQLTRLGGFHELEVIESVASSDPYAYRNHAQFHLDKEGGIGFQKSFSHDVVRINRCLLLEKPLNDLIPSLSFEPESGLQRVAMRDDGTGTSLLYLSGDTPNPPEFEVDFPLNVVYHNKVGDMGLSGEFFNNFEILEKTFQVSAGSFFQTNRDVATRMVQFLLKEFDTQKNSTILDLFCGVGFFSSFLAENAGKIIGIESSESACDDFAINLDAFDNVDLYQGNVEEILPSLNMKVDIAIVDPPRAGLASTALNALVKTEPEKIAYISCDPSTLARDLKLFAKASFEIESVTLFDMFPQTYHIESIAILKNRSKFE